jgi:flavodoxin
MKSIVVYFSYSGNTRKVADILGEYLKAKGEVVVKEIKALDESANFFMQCARAFKKINAQIEPMNLELSGYDLICLGTPVWAFAPAPAMNTCLDKCFGLAGKQITLFTTYGSGTGNERCLKAMQDALIKKGAGKIKKFSIQQSKVNDKEFVIFKIKETLA